MANTDRQALENSKAVMENSQVVQVLQLGVGITKGLGAGADPMLAENLRESYNEIRAALEGADMVFVTAGFGGGTGSGAAPEIAAIAKEMGILTAGEVVTKPFMFEGRKRMVVADAAIEMAKNVDSLIVIPNNKLMNVLGKSVTLLSAFRAANEVLRNAVEGISYLITRPGMINVDYADVKAVMSKGGNSMMGSGQATGDGRAAAAEAAISKPLEDVDLYGAKGVLVNITAGSDMSIGEFELDGDILREFTSDEATVVVGTVIDTELQDNQ